MAPKLYQQDYGSLPSPTETPSTSKHNSSFDVKDDVADKSGWCKTRRPCIDRFVLLLAGIAFGTLIGHQVFRFANKQHRLESFGEDASPHRDNVTPAAATPDVDNTTFIWEELRRESLVENVEHGAVATDDGRCSDLGNHVLGVLGGNAIDAAVAVTLCLGIVNPAGSTPGGGGFVLLHADAASKPPNARPRDFHDARRHPYDDAAEGKVTEAVDCREIAPLGAHGRMFDDANEDASWTGGLASGVPGQLHCLELMHSRHGSLPWKVVVEQVVRA